MSDLPDGKQSEVIRITGGDEVYQADVVLEGGVKKLMVAADVTIDEVRGKDMYPSSWTEITNAVASTTITLTIGSHGPWVIPISTTDIYVAAEQAVSYLNGQSTYNQYFTARKVLDNAIFHTESDVWGEAGEETTYSASGSGGTTTNDGFGDFRIRRKVNSLSFDVRDPRVGILGISGSVTQIPGELSKLCIINPTNATYGAEMNKNGSVTPIIYEIACIANEDRLVKELRFYANAAGIKFGQFLNINTVLTNGIEIKIKSNNEVSTLPLIKTTEGFQTEFALGKVNFQFFSGAGLDNILASFQFENPFVIKRSGSYTVDDYIQVKIQDNLSAVSKLRVLAFGFRQ